MWPIGMVSIACLLFWSGRAWDAARNGPTVGTLAAQAPLPRDRSPAVAIVVAARNEVDGVTAGVGSLLRFDYPRCEVVAVDDRSTDATGRALRLLARQDPRLQVRRVERLPEGWLGKNHALALGAEATTAEWLLFMDADIQADATALARAVAYAESRRLDHLTVIPQVRCRTLGLRLFTAYVAFLLIGVYRPWRVRDPRRSEFLGIGAFNLVRRSAYLRAGGHAAIRACPDDDMRLAERLKRAGGRADVLLGRELLAVEWQPSLRAAVRAMEKTAFASLGFNVVTTVAGVAGLLLLGLLPPVLALGAHDWPRWPAALAAVLSMVLFARAGAAVTDFPPAAALLLPFMHPFWAFVQTRAAVAVIHRGGIVWRDTFYPLALLRKSQALARQG